MNVSCFGRLSRRCAAVRDILRSGGPVLAFGLDTGYGERFKTFLIRRKCLYVGLRLNWITLFVIH